MAEAKKDMFVAIPGQAGEWALMPNKPTSKRPNRFELKCSATKHRYVVWSPVVRKAEQLDWVKMCPDHYEKANAIPSAVASIFAKAK